MQLISVILSTDSPIYCFVPSAMQLNLNQAKWHQIITVAKPEPWLDTYKKNIFEDNSAALVQA